MKTKVQRIRYKDHPDKENVKVSNVLVTKRGARYKVEIHINDMFYRIININNGKAEVSTEKYTNYNVLLRKAKERMYELGLDMPQEMRNRTFGLCPTGYTQKQERENRKKLAEIAFKLGKKVEELTEEDVLDYNVGEESL
jgi:hypothetical protein